MIDTLLSKARAGFSTLTVSDKYQEQAMSFLEKWLTEDQYKDYIPQIEHLVVAESWDYLLDSFYQVIPFGTGGRRGEVGVGPNRINPITIRNSAQGHAQYLLKHYGDDARNRGVVLAYDVREFRGVQQLDANLPSPVHGMTSRDLAFGAAEIYAGNGILTYIFEDVRTTPELSFAVRHLSAVGGDVFSASHNPPTHNGKKVYDEFGGQLIPPHDESLVNEVTQNVTTIQSISLDEGKKQGLIKVIGAEIDEAYIAAASAISLSDARDISIVYSPLHGAGTTSIPKILRGLGFTVSEDPKTSNQSGAFENITFNIPNPEVTQSFDTSLRYAKEIDADILINSDPDADRVGIMVKHKDNWEFINGNEIATILTQYAATRLKTQEPGIVIKTVVTTGAIKSICERYNLNLIDGLLIGFKYVGDIMNNLELDGRIDNFLLGVEESHGYIAGNYARDKDAATGAIWLAELAAELKSEGKTLLDYLNEIYLESGYYKNYLTEIRMLGASGNEKIHRIQEAFRKAMPKSFGEYKVIESTDYQTHAPIVSETDMVAKDILVFHLEGNDRISSIKVTIRPSGTEPKIKIYLELGYLPTADGKELAGIIEDSDTAVSEIEKAVLLEMYKAIEIDFPERGFLLFWQLPLDDKLRYLELEPQLAAIRNISDKSERQRQVDSLLGFLGSNPIQKIDQAFKAKYKSSVSEFLSL